MTDPPAFSLVPGTLEPGCYRAGVVGIPAMSGIDVTQTGREAQVSIVFGAPSSVDQILVPSANATGYRVYTSFDTGTSVTDPDIDPVQNATDLTGPGGSNADATGIIVCVSDHPDKDQNEAYMQDGPQGEVAAINRPIIQPTIAALGVSAVGPLHTYRVAFGYTVPRRYDMTWRNLFGAGGDPMQLGGFTGVRVLSDRAQQGGVRRFNDIDQFGEAFRNGTERSDYGQPEDFDLNGDPQAYLHNSRGQLLTFTTQGDLPISWSVKPSLAPESYGRSVTLTDDMLRAWNKSWQDYYAGKGPKPTLPLAPGTNSPDIDPSIPDPKAREGADENGKQTTIVTPAPAPAPNGPIQPVQTTRKMSVSAQLMKNNKGARRVQLFVSAPTAKTATVRIKLYSHGRMVSSASKTVKTNRFVNISGLKVAKKITSVKATVIG